VSPKKKPDNNRVDPEEALERASSELARRTPPHNLEAEQAVLGGVFLRNSIFHELIDVISEDDFYSPVHRTIFRAFLDLYSHSSAIDLVTCAAKLQEMNKLDEIGGQVYLIELAESVVTAANAQHHAEIVRQKSVQRQLIEAAAGIIADAYGGGEIDRLVDSSQQAMFKIAEQRQTTTFSESKPLVDRVFEQLEARSNRREMVTGVPTGYHKLDEMTAGLQPSDLIIIAGRPSMGKTAFALNLAKNAAVDHEVSTVVFSLEMSMEQLMQRLLAIVGRVDLSKVRRGYLDDEDWQGLFNAAQQLQYAPIFIDDTPALSVMELRARCRRLKMEKNLGLIVVDYLQLMRASRYIDSREQEISDISRNLKAIAKELDVPVIALSQLNRRVEERTNRRPMLADLRESGAIEQDADVIAFIYRDEVYNKESPDKGTAEIIIGKQRNGPVGEVKLAFIGPCTAFGELSYVPEPSESMSG
jgi:replicative DNA helicase